MAELCPREERMTWFKLIWEEGYPWEPIERFMIYEMIPAHAVEEEVLAQLQRATPPQGYWDTVKEAFIPEDGCLITKRAHRLFKETNCWGRPYWVIQGTKGGHKRWFSESERKLLKLAGLPQDPPAPGDLDYAPWDERVVSALMQHDLLRDEMGRIRGKVELSLGQFRAREEAEAKAFRKKLVAWLSEQVSEIAPDAHRALQQLDAPRADLEPARIQEAQEKSEESFIETGRA